MSASWSTLITLVPAVLAILAVAAFAFQIRGFERKAAATLLRLDGLRQDLERGKDKGKREDLQQLKNELRGDITALKSLIGNIPRNTAQLIADTSSRSYERTATPPPSRAPIAVRAYQSYEETQEPEDGVSVLLQLANRIARNGSISLETARESANALGASVSPWSVPGDGGTTAFIVDYRGSSYVVPNVVKPARLRKEWFNRSDFGVNDEIQAIRSLPRLRRRGDDFDVLDAGEFTR
jgi:hypothetical protein